MIFSNPVKGRIQPHSERWDGRSFRVTAPFGHVGGRHRTPHQGVDMGNGTSGDPVFAMAAGRVSEIIDGRPTAALIVRIRHPDEEGRYETGYAHLKDHNVHLEKQVKRGDQIGIVGRSGARLPHLHGGCKDRGVEIDWWPMLAQNQPDVQITTVVYPHARTWRARGGFLTGRRLALAPLTKKVTFVAGSPAQANAEVTIKPTPPGWPAGPYLQVTTGGLQKYLVAMADVDPGVKPKPQDVQAAVQAAVTPLQKKITILETKVAQLQAKLGGTASRPPG